MPWTLSAFADEAGDTTELQIKALQRAGYKHIDIRGIDGHNCTVLPLDKAEGIRRKLDAAGIAVAMFGSPIGKIDIADDMKIDLDKLRHLAALKPILGCNAVRIFSYYNKANAPLDQWKKESLRRLKALRDLAGELGMVLYHENERHIYGDRCPEVQVIASEVRDGKAFRLIFDFDNYNQSGDNVWDNWTRLASVTDGIHLKDSATNAQGQNQHVPVGQGNGQVRKILADALQRKWSGPMSLEPHLNHSKAVVATGPSGVTNQAFADMSPADCFHVAAQAANQLLAELKAPVA